ncbi:MAG: hypothetical protein WC119_00810 [Synergistaceae bacterium]
MQFVCKKCGGTRLEEVMVDVTVSSMITSIAIEDGEINLEYGEQSYENNEGGTVESYQCMDCGQVIARSQEELIEALSGKECLVDSDGCLIDNDGDAETDMEDR